jgi:hypothetical protein
VAIASQTANSGNVWDVWYSWFYVVGPRSDKLTGATARTSCQKTKSDRKRHQNLQAQPLAREPSISHD